MSLRWELLRSPILAARAGENGDRRFDISVVAEGQLVRWGKAHLDPFHPARIKPAREAAKDSHTIGRSGRSLHLEQIGHNRLHSPSIGTVAATDGDGCDRYHGNRVPRPAIRGSLPRQLRPQAGSTD